MKHLKIVISVIIILTLFASCKKPTEPETGNIKGVVIDDSTGIPVEGVLVTLAKMEQDTTDSLGQFYFGDVEEGTYSLEFSKYPYRDTTLTAYVEGGKTWEIEVRMRYLGLPEWHVVDSIGEPVVQVFFVDYWTGWALCGGDGLWWGDRLYRTMDGDNFTLVHQFSSEDSIRRIFFVNSYVGWAVGMKIWKTEDGGYTWIEKMNVDSIYGGIARGVYFYNENEGLVVGGKSRGHNVSSEYIWRTEDGGNTWTEHTWTEYDPYYGEILYDVTMKERWGLIAGLYWGTGWDWHIPGCLYSSDSGKTWNPVEDHFTFVTRIPFHRVQFYGEEHAVKLCIGGTIAFSTNNGVDWYNMEQYMPDTQAYSVYFTDEFHGWLGAANGIYFTRDEGNNWVIDWAGGRVTSLYMLDANWGYAGTYNGLILRYKRRE